MFKQSAKKSWMPAVWILAIAIVGMAAIAGSSHLRTRSARTLSTQVPATVAQSGRVRADLDALPLAFEANQGQADPQVKYTGTRQGIHRVFDGDETVFAMQASRANVEHHRQGSRISLRRKQTRRPKMKLLPSG